MGLFSDFLAGWRSDFLARRGYEKAHSIKPPPYFNARTSADRHSVPDRALAGNQARLYEKLSWVNIAVRYVSDACAAVPFMAKTIDGEEITDEIDHPMEQLLRKPNPLMGKFQFIRAHVASEMLTGNVYWWLNAPSPDAPPTEIWHIPSHKITPIPDGRLYISGYEYDDNGAKFILRPDEIIHFKSYNPLNEFVGLSRISTMAEVAVGDLNMQKWNTNFFAEQNAKLPGALAFADNLPKASFEQIRADLTSKHGGTERNMMLLKGVGQGQVKWLPMGIPQKDMEFLAGRQFNREEIFQLYGLHMGLVSENSTEANATVARALFNEFTLWPTLVAIAEKMTLRLASLYDDNLLATFKDPRVTDQRIELDRQQTRKDYYTIDELRAEDGKDEIGDERGELLPVELARGKTGGETPEQLLEFTGEDTEDEPEEPDTSETPEETEDEPDEEEAPAEKAMVKFDGDLRLWRKKALRMMAEKGLAVTQFNSEIIPLDIRNRIAESLATATDADAVKAVFSEVLDDELSDDKLDELADAVLEAAEAV